eukprot:c39047_g1_i1.p1 GENE.c39047_g1_i1~~c39047_g1_i1.p1  ORF type:complete len:218 (-),score=35.39 c39047_g1_i1:118-771(-)
MGGGRLFQNFTSNMPEQIFVLALVGDSGVGKTALLGRYVNNDFNDYFVATIGVEFKIKTIDMGSTRTKLNIWDTAGQERYRAIAPNYYRGAHGIVVVYDITSYASLENVRSWIRDIRAYASPNVKLILMGNKADLTDRREVSFEEGKAIADSFSMLFAEVSARTGDGVEPAFTSLVSAIFEASKSTTSDTHKPSTPAAVNVHAKSQPGSTGAAADCC